MLVGAADGENTVVIAAGKKREGGVSAVGFYRQKRTIYEKEKKSASRTLVTSFHKKRGKKEKRFDGRGGKKEGFKKGGRAGGRDGVPFRAEEREKGGDGPLPSKRKKLNER